MNQKRKTYKFERISENKKIYLISPRQKKAIKNHGSKSHQLPNKQGTLTFQWWYLLPGIYYIYEYSKEEKGYYVYRLFIREINDQFIEEHRPVDSIPQWLKALLSTLPDYKEKDIGKYDIHTTSRREG